MSEPFIGEIKMFAGNFAPRGWAMCDGQLLAIAQNNALFALLGTTYGGDGRTTFGLPDMRGRVPVHPGTGPGLSNRRQGEMAGAESHTLTIDEIPNHTHGVQAINKPGDSGNPENRLWAASSGTPLSYSDATPDISMSSDAVTTEGGGQQHNNMMPTLCIHFIIALFGIFPSRN
jgi:microcystin-dependent protein